MKTFELKSLIVAAAVLALVAMSRGALADTVTGQLTTGLSASNGSNVNGVVIAPPVATPPAGSYTSAQSVTLTADGASSIYYTTDGSTPSCTAGTAYSGAIAVGATMTIEAVACYPNSQSSTVASYAYTIAALPSASISSGGGGGGGGGGIVSGGGGGTGYYSPLVPSTTSTTSPTTSEGQVLGASAYQFTVNLHLGMSGDAVTQLQERLTADGVYSGPITGYFGPLTLAAVKAYQTKHGIVPVSGFVGSLTRAQLNQGLVLGASTVSTSSLQAQIAALEAEVAALTQKLAQMRSGADPN